MTYEEWKQKIKGMGYVVHEGISVIAVAFWNNDGKRELITWDKTFAAVDITGFGGDKFKEHPIYESWKNMINAYMDENDYKCKRIV